MEDTEDYFFVLHASWGVNVSEDPLTNNIFRESDLVEAVMVSTERVASLYALSLHTQGICSIELNQRFGGSAPSCYGSIMHVKSNKYLSKLIKKCHMSMPYAMKEFCANSPDSLAHKAVSLVVNGRYSTLLEDMRKLSDGGV